MNSHNLLKLHCTECGRADRHSKDDFVKELREMVLNFCFENFNTSCPEAEEGGEEDRGHTVKRLWCWHIVSVISVALS